MRDLFQKRDKHKKIYKIVIKIHYWLTLKIGIKIYMSNQLTRNGSVSYCNPGLLFTEQTAKKRCFATASVGKV